MTDLYTKAELVDDIAALTGVEKATIRTVLLAHSQSIATAVENGKTVRLSGLGTFKHSKRKAMVARNPRTGQTYEKPETKTVRFSISQTLKDAVK